MQAAAPEIIHSPPHMVKLNAVEDELSALSKVGATGNAPNTPIMRACTLTLVIKCDAGEDPEVLEPLIGQVVASNPARVILIASENEEPRDELEARISVYQTEGYNDNRLVGEEIDFYPRDPKQELLPSAILSLRVSGLPLVLYWRGQPDLEDRLFHALVNECDQILFDSQHFTARAERVNNTIARLRQDYPQVSFGDVNWQRIRPWRELTAQFFDDQTNLAYLDAVTHVEVDFSVGLGGNQSAAILFIGWLASSLGWDVVHGSYQRDGQKRIMRFQRAADGKKDGLELEVIVLVRSQPDCMPGELTGVRLSAQPEIPATFELSRVVGGFVESKYTIGSKSMERTVTLVIPEDSNVVTSELDAVRRDRNYHRSLELIDELVSHNL